MVVTEVRKYMEAAVEKLTPARAQEMARSLMQGQGKEQVQKVAQDLMDWSNQTRERLSDMVRREVTRQLKSMGVASKDDVEDLKRRVRELERRAGRSAPAAKSMAKSAASSTAKRRAVAKKTTTRRTSTGASDRTDS